ncbi:MAG: hypothetical protein J6I98_00340 [Clostridia bacterium]|nr:hypothetical protein [Clostridia bacterium]
MENMWKNRRLRAALGRVLTHALREAFLKAEEHFSAMYICFDDFEMLNSSNCQSEMK